MEENFTLSINASIVAGLEIMDIYKGDIEVEFKADNSPLTIADKNSNLVISNALETTGIPILSEEGREVPYEEREKWDLFWMVDPLDGTKEFIKGNGEFTVNIALMKGGKPLFGVIYVPVVKALYFGGKSFGSYKIENINTEKEHYQVFLEMAKSLPYKAKNEKYTMIGSRSHMSEETEAYFNKVKKEQGEIEVFSAGSSLKLCLVAEGTADEYPRFAPTMEWDTAAGQAILEGAGKKLTHYKSGASMKYNKVNLLNDWFVAESH